MNVVIPHHTMEQIVIQHSGLSSSGIGRLHLTHALLSSLGK